MEWAALPVAESDCRFVLSSVSPCFPPNHVACSTCGTCSTGGQPRRQNVTTTRRAARETRARDSQRRGTGGAGSGGERQVQRKTIWHKAARNKQADDEGNQRILITWQGEERRDDTQPTTRQTQEATSSAQGRERKDLVGGQKTLGSSNE